MRPELLEQIAVVYIGSPSFVPTVEKRLSLSRDTRHRHPVERTEGEERGRKEVYATIQSSLLSRTVRREAHSTMAFSGGWSYSPTMSGILASSSGSVENLNLFGRSRTDRLPASTTSV